ncbi:MAG: class I SAM-dependent methyltransferase [Lachnospiraceae bacterium]|nr:class I SAM-dependent methyltransferase [Lachnospiraceae bacterium]
MTLNNTHFCSVNECHWCGCKEATKLYTNLYDATIVKCNNCGFVYSNKILNEAGLKAYWSNYESNVHCADKKLNEQRLKMYQLDFDFIKRYIDLSSADVLDVGCANGLFLDLFHEAGANCIGAEFGKEAACEAQKKYKVYFGEFPELPITEKFDLIIFRGVIQYFIHPKRYLAKAIQLLKNGGLLFITSSANADSYCFNLFKENFTLPCGVTDYYAFNERIITDYLKSLHAKLLAKYHFYSETPYANPAEDILKVAKATALANDGKEIHFRSPAFFDNMLTLVYKKTE